MYACVLIPKSLSLVLQLHPNQANLLEMSAAVWSNLHLTPGTILHPDEGEVRLDRLEVYGVLRDDDIRRKYGCYDIIHEVDGQKVRHCNWIRFVKASSDSDKVNIISSIVKGHPFFQVIKPIKPNDELVVLFHDDSSETSTSCNEVTKVTMSSPSRQSTPDRSQSAPNGGSSDTTEEEEDEDSSPEKSNQSSCHQLVPSEERYSRQLQDVSNDESARWGKDKQVSSGEEDSVSSPQEADKDIPQSSDTADPHQHSDSDQCSPREDRATSCEGFEVDPCPVVSTTTPIPEVPSRLFSDGAPTRRGRERTWWPCDTCPKKFDRPSLLKRHIRTHTGEKPHACDVCGKAFSTSSSLNTHRRIHSGEKPHQCPVCGKRFTASSNLYYHRMTHSKEKPHKCQLCSKSFPTPGDLRSHMHIHNGSWPFHCDVCNRGFSKHTNLRNHMLLHTGDKPHECSTCRKRFALQCNLKAHLKTHVGDKSSPCTKCGRELSDNVKMASVGLCSGCSEDSTKASSQKNKQQVTVDSTTDFSIAKLTATSPRASTDKASSPGASSISSASSAESTSPPCGQFNGHRPWLSPFSSTSSSSLTSPPARSCVMTSVPSLPHYMFLESKTATSPSVFFAQEMMSREAFMPTARASLPYPMTSPWKQQMIAQAF